jgi:quinol monooxygenase YgiN
MLSAETMMEIFVFARLHARPGKQGDVQQAMFEVQGPTRKEPGCLSYGGFRSVRDPDEFYIHTRWQDMAAFERHAELSHSVRFVETVEPLLDHPFKVTLAGQLW